VERGGVNVRHTPGCCAAGDIDYPLQFPDADWYDDWKSAVLECQRCGWKGSFDQGAVEHYEALMDCSCPDCPWPDTPILAIVSYPTIQELVENWFRLSESERQHVTARKDLLQQWEAARLVSPEQLPELEGSDLTFSWDYVDAGTARMTVIRHGTTELWHEPALSLRGLRQVPRNRRYPSAEVRCPRCRTDTGQRAVPVW
jgi:hypothetical protein